jgi:hypothetical protein
VVLKTLFVLMALVVLFGIGLAIAYHAARLGFFFSILPFLAFFVGVTGFS